VSGQLYPQGKNLQYLRTRRLAVLEDRSEHYEKNKSVEPAGNRTSDLPALRLVTIEYCN
jgi:hypothetical protein